MRKAVSYIKKSKIGYDPLQGDAASQKYYDASCEQ